jgi:acetyltransferase-like isoleucine patch superfamily enzyme
MIFQIQKLLTKIKQNILLYRYNNFTIAEYFKKQGAQIGEGCYFAIRNLGPEPYLIKIGNNVAVTSGVLFNTHDGGTWIFRDEFPDLRLFGPIVINDNCIIGSNAQIFPNVTIGPNSIVGGGSVVITDVPPNTIVMGVPARQFGSVSKYREKCLQQWEIQRPENYKGDSVRHFDLIKNSEKIMAQLRSHLLSVFKDKLG